MNTVEPFAFVITFLLGGVILIGLFITVIILKSKLLGTSRYFLAISLLGLLQHLGTYLLFTTHLIEAWPHLLGVGYPLLFLVGPCFYLFIKYYGKVAFRLKWFEWLHFLPFILVLFASLPALFKTAKEKLELIRYYYEVLPNGPVAFSQWFSSSLHLFQLFGYAVAALLLLGAKDKKNGVLLKRISALLLVLATLEMALQTGFLLSNASAITSEIVLSGCMAMAILLLGFWIVDIRQIIPVLERSKYKTSPLSEAQSHSIQNKIENFLEEEEGYLKPDLKIAHLAKAVDIPSHHISQVLSENMHTNFFELVNHYRVEKAKELLHSELYHKLSVQAIGEECGFSSKTSFYRAFKKATAMTPVEFVSMKK